MSRLIRVWSCVFLVMGTVQGCGPKDGNGLLNNQSLRAANLEAKMRSSADAGVAPDPAIDARTHFAAGRLLEGRRQFDKAIEQYRFAVVKAPGYVEVHNRLGVIYGLLNMGKEAESSLTRAIELRPDSPHLLNNYGFEFLRQKRFGRAEQEFRRALEIAPVFLKARGNLAVSLAAQARFDEALAEFRLTLPESDALYNLGLALRAHSRNEDARVAFERVLAINPEFEAASRQLAGIPTEIPVEEKTGLDAETELKLVQSLAPARDSGEVVTDDWAQVILSLVRELDEVKETMRRKDLMMAQHAALIGQQQAVVRMQEDGPVDADMGPLMMEAVDVGPVAMAVDVGGATMVEPDEKVAVMVAATSVLDRSSAGLAEAVPGVERCFDFDRDSRLDLIDFSGFQSCFGRGNEPLSERCRAGDMDEDGDVDLADFREMYRLLDTSGCPF